MLALICQIDPEQTLIADRWFVWIPEVVKPMRCDTIPQLFAYFPTLDCAEAFCKACRYTYEIKMFGDWNAK